MLNDGQKELSKYRLEKAVLALEGFDSKKHSGVIAEFQRRFVKTNVFEREYSKIIMSASEIRNASDYDDYYIASKDEANNQLLNAKKLYGKVCDYLRERLDMNK